MFFAVAWPYGPTAAEFLFEAFDHKLEEDFKLLGLGVRALVYNSTMMGRLQLQQGILRHCRSIDFSGFRIHWELRNRPRYKNSV